MLHALQRGGSLRRGDVSSLAGHGDLRVRQRLRTMIALLAHLAGRQRWFLLPLVVMLLLTALLLGLTETLGVAAPFIYAVF